MKYGYVGCSAVAGGAYCVDPADAVAREANSRSLDMDPPQELVAFSVRDAGNWLVVDMVFRWPLEPSSEELKR